MREATHMFMSGNQWADEQQACAQSNLLFSPFPLSRSSSHHVWQSSLASLAASLLSASATATTLLCVVMSRVCHTLVPPSFHCQSSVPLPPSLPPLALPPLVSRHLVLDD